MKFILTHVNHFYGLFYVNVCGILTINKSDLFQDNSKCRNDIAFYVNVKGHD